MSVYLNIRNSALAYPLYNLALHRTRFSALFILVQELCWFSLHHFKQHGFFQVHLQTVFERTRLEGFIQSSWRTKHRFSVDLSYLKSFCLVMQSQIDFMMLRFTSHWRKFSVTLAVCLWPFSCSGINLGHIVCLPDGTAWLISICLHFSGLRTQLILTKLPTPFPEMQPQTCKHASLLPADSHYSSALHCFGIQTAVCHIQIFQILNH